MEKEDRKRGRKNKTCFVIFLNGSHHLMCYLMRKQEKEAPPVQRRPTACPESADFSNHWVLVDLFYGSEL